MSNKEKHHSARQIANWFIKESNYSLSNMQIQKLVYFSYGWLMAFHKKILIDEPIEAWQYGTVVPSLYQDLRTYRKKNVTKRIEPENYNCIYKEKIDGQTLEVLNFVKACYGNKSATFLSNLTHVIGGAWHKAIENNLTIIPTEFIKKEFEDKLVRAKETHKEGKN